MLIGAVIARAILDERVVDLPLNPLFWSIVLNKVKLIFKFILLSQYF